MRFHTTLLAAAALTLALTAAPAAHSQGQLPPPPPQNQPAGAPPTTPPPSADDASAPNYIPSGCTAGYFQCWQANATATQNAQPKWMTPLVTVTPRLEQEFRTDFLRQIAPGGTTTWNYDNSKGLEFIPWRNVEIIINLPPYIQHNMPGNPDGFGDLSFLAKYRILSRNQAHGNYILTFFLAGTLATGSHQNGEPNSIVTPTLAAGKGWGIFDIQTTLGDGIPVAAAVKNGEPLAWNTTAQVHLQKYFWPEIEDNMTHYINGHHDGLTQNFVTPGIIFGRFQLAPQRHPRLGLALGAGFQTATSGYHQYNHELIFTARMPF